MAAESQISQNVPKYVGTITFSKLVMIS